MRGKRVSREKTQNVVDVFAAHLFVVVGFQSGGSVQNRVAARHVLFRAGARETGRMHEFLHNACCRSIQPFRCARSKSERYLKGVSRTLERSHFELLL